MPFHTILTGHRNLLVVNSNAQKGYKYTEKVFPGTQSIRDQSNQVFAAASQTLFVQVAAGLKPKDTAGLVCTLA